MMGIDLHLFVVDVGMEFGPFLPGKAQHVRTHCGIERAVLIILGDERAIKTTELVDRVIEMTRCKRISVSHRLTFMKKAGAVQKHAGGYYQIGKG